jgi:hypothetical protein
MADAMKASIAAGGADIHLPLLHVQGFIKAFAQLSGYCCN